MINDNINKLILDAMKSKDKVRVESLRAIKTALVNYEIAHKNNQIDEAAEASLIKKLVDVRLEDAKMYRKAGRDDLAEVEEAQANVIGEFLPAEVTEDQISTAIESIIESGTIEPIKKNMKAIVNAVKEIHPTADGGLVFKLVSSRVV